MAIVTSAGPRPTQLGQLGVGQREQVVDGSGLAVGQTHGHQLMGLAAVLGGERDGGARRDHVGRARELVVGRHDLDGGHLGRRRGGGLGGGCRHGVVGGFVAGVGRAGRPDERDGQGQRQGPAPGDD